MKLARFFYLCILIVSLTISGCAHKTGTPEKQSSYSLPFSERDFYIGLVPTPRSIPETSFEDITAAYEETGRLCEVVMVWGSPGGIGLYEKLKQNRVVTAVRVYGIKPVLTLNFHTIKEIPNEGLKPLIDAPEGIRAAVSDQEFRQLWINEAGNIAREFQPEYFSLGNEINDYFFFNPDDLEGYLTLLDEAYSVIKQESPDTKVMVVFSYTHLIDNDQWDLLGRFDNIDIIGFTTYPWKHFDTPEEIDRDYYTRIQQYTDKPVAFTEIGWAGEEEIQSQFLVNFLELTVNLDMEMVNWLLLHEIEFEGTAKSVFSPESSGIALKKADGTPKQIYKVWQDLKNLEIK